MQGVASGGQGNIGPLQPRLAHVDANVAARRAGGCQNAGNGLDPDGFRSALVHQHGGNATRAVAAGLDLVTIAVADFHERIGAAAVGGLDDQQLVAADPGSPVGDGACVRGAEADWRHAGIEDHEIVAQAVHLGESKCVHTALNMPPGDGSPPCSRLKRRLSSCRNRRRP